MCEVTCTVVSWGASCSESVCRPQVQSIMERVIVLLLSQVVERSSQEKVFSLHPRTERCKLLWRDGQAVGFYTVKHKGIHTVKPNPNELHL